MREEQIADILRIAGSRASELRRYLVAEGFLSKADSQHPSLPEPEPEPEPEENDAQVEGADAELEKEYDDGQ